MLEEKLGRRILVLPEAQITGAIGAALIAGELDG
jgi:activator of 2-hydroxyglutaryl-CoA dehydratase